MKLSERLYDDHIWSLKYRPKTIDELIVPDRIRQDIDLNNNYLFSGPPGIGKTSLAVVLAEADDRDIMYINASKDTSVDILRTRITQFVSSASCFDEKKLVILDEFDRASAQFQDSTKVAIEEFSKVANFVFITNHRNRIIAPLQSRLVHVDFALTIAERKELMTKFFKRVLEILGLENVEHDQKVVAQIVKNNFPDMRKTLNELQRHSSRKDGLKTAGYIKASGADDIADYFRLLSKKDFAGCRTYIAGIGDSTSFFSSLYESFGEYVDENSVAEFIVLVGEYAYKASQVVDQQINLAAFSVECMTQINFQEIL